MDAKKSLPVVACFILLWGGHLAAQGTGGIEGRVVKEGKGLPGITVLVVETKAATVTEKAGKFAFADLPVGSYTLLFSIGDKSLTQPNVAVDEGVQTPLEVEVDWIVGAFEVLTVYSASRKKEKIVDAPASVTVIPEEQIEQEAAHGQLPKILEFTPGAEVTQSGLYDFNFNTRGFNSSLNRRVAVYIDGRDASAPFLGAQEWAALSTPLDDLAGVEFIRGPSAALYGQNASSGVINMTTRAPKDSLGGTVRVTLGELETKNVDFRWAHGLGREWYLKVVAGVRDTGDFRVSRNGTCEGGEFDGEPCASDAGCEAETMGAENGTCIFPKLRYSRPCGRATEDDDADELLNPDLRETPCLPVEAIPILSNENQIYTTALRLDKYLWDASLFTLEAGYGNIEGPTFQTGIGRVASVDVKRPWGRFAYSRPHWNAIASYARRDGAQQSLQSAADLFTDTERYAIEFQTNWDILGERGRVVAGGAAIWEDIDTADPAGKQTLLLAPVDSNRQAIFGQFDWRFNKYLKAVFAGRVDWSTLHATQFSPKLALLYNINPQHTLRFTFNRAFQVANYSEFFLFAEVTQTNGLSVIDEVTDPGGVPWCARTSPDFNPSDPSTWGTCGFSEVPIYGVGREDLVLEETEAWEIGYSAILGRKAFLSIDYYNSENVEFITDLLNQVNSPIGVRDEQTIQNCPLINDIRLTNPNIKCYEIPEEWKEIQVFGPLTLFDIVRNNLYGNPADPNNDGLAGPVLINNGVQLVNDPLTGGPGIVARSYTNFGVVDTQGVDLGLQCFLTKRLKLLASASWFDFEPQTDDPEKAKLLLPNTPEYKVSLGLNYTAPRWSIGMSGRWVDSFPWLAGIFEGPVTNNPPNSTDATSYAVFDFLASYTINDHFKWGVNASNAFNYEQYQSFGGDVLSRRALAYFQYDW